MAATDQLQRFIFDGTDVRGEIIRLEKSYQQVLENGNYPPIIAQLMGEMLAATGLLSATMKFDGIFTLQARGQGDLTLIMSDCTRQHLLRGIARLQPGANPVSRHIGELLGSGHLAITVDPAQGERYQGIVPLEGASLAQCLQDYFQQSEQLPTALWLFADGASAGGLLLQALPTQLQTLEERDQYWRHLSILADTLSAAEFLGTDINTLLLRLFHEEDLRLFEPSAMEFGCSCSQARTARMLSSLGEAEVQAIIAELGTVEVKCEFCNQEYRFDPSQVEEIFNSDFKTLH